MSGFHHHGDAPTWTARMRWVNTDPFHALMVGGHTGDPAHTGDMVCISWSGWGNSRTNWLKWDTEKERFLHVGVDMWVQHDHAAAAPVPVDVCPY